MSKEFSLSTGKDLLLIDKNNLDEMVMKQPSLYCDIAEQHVLAMSERDAAKEALSEVDAILTSEFRCKAEESKEKITEAKLMQKVQIDERHGNAYAYYATLKLKAERWGILRDSFAQRASMLKHLCELYSSEYFARESMTKSRDVSQVRLNGKQRLINDRVQQRVRRTKEN